MRENNIKHKMVVGIFFVPEDDAQDVADSLEQWFDSHDIGMDWHSIQVTHIIDIDRIAG